MKRAVWLLILGLLFALTGCGKEEPLQEAFSPQQVVLYARWSEGEYCVVSRSADGGAVQVDRYDAELSPLESVTAGSWQELQGNLPPDFCAADRERGVVVTGAEEVALDETMGERFAFGEGIFSTAARRRTRCTGGARKGCSSLRWRELWTWRTWETAGHG